MLACDSLICQCFSLDNITTGETANTCSSLYHDNKLYLVTKYPETFIWLCSFHLTKILSTSWLSQISHNAWTENLHDNICGQEGHSKALCLFDGRWKKSESHVYGLPRDVWWSGLPPVTQSSCYLIPKWMSVSGLSDSHWLQSKNHLILRQRGWLTQLQCVVVMATC